jgi:hypothetical protein
MLREMSIPWVQGVDRLEIVNRPVVPERQFIRKLLPCLAPPNMEMRLQGSRTASPNTIVFTWSFTAIV